MPVIAPVVELRVRPEGRDPLAMENVRGAMPPDVDTPDVTAPTAMLGIDVEMILTEPAGLALIVPVNVRLWVCDSVSETLTVKLKFVPPLVIPGVPEMSPVVASIDKPEGMVPLEIVNE